MLVSRLGLVSFLEAAAPAPSKGFDLGIWYALVIIGASAFVVFYIIKRISDIAVNRKTEAMIRQFSDVESNDSETDKT